PAGADLLGILVVDGGDVKAALAEAGVLDERTDDSPRADEHDAVGASQAQDVADAGGELGDRIPEPAFAEGAEEGEVLADLRRGGTAAPPALTTGAERPVTAITTLRSCFRRRVKQAVTNARNAGTSPGSITGSSSGVSRTSALRTRGRGVNAPAGTMKSLSTRHCACTLTESAP